ncbi:MAG: hypothetical protein GX490_03800 [Bacilli bacterium]|nr:hypothetical protein [Bacilli bacterium]
MKKRFILLVLLVVVLGGCKVTNKTTSVIETTVLDEYTQFVSMFTEAKDKFLNSDSFILEEESMLEFEQGESLYRFYLIAHQEQINEPFYLKGIITSLGLNTPRIKMLIIKNKTNDTYSMYLKRGDEEPVVTIMTQSELEEELENASLDTTLNRIPESVEISEKTIIDNIELITYQTTFTLNDLEEDQYLFDEILELYIGESVNIEKYYEIPVKQTITINKTLKELVSITYDISSIAQQMMDDLAHGQSIDNLTNIKLIYTFSFISINKTNSDENFIKEITGE